MKKSIVLITFCSLILSPLLSSMLQADTNDTCVERLKDLGRKCLRYAEKNNGRMPASLSELYYRAYINDLDAFICPGSPTEIEHRTEIDEKADYVLSPEASGAGLRPVVQDRSADNHDGKGTYVFYSDGSLRWRPGAGVATATPERMGTILLDDNFDAENRGSGRLNYSGFENWEVTDGTVDLIGKGFWDFFPSHGLYLDLDGSTWDAGTLESKATFRLEPGTYRLEFDLAGSPLSGPNMVAVRLGNVYSEDVTMAMKEPYTTVTREIVVSAATNGKLIFHHAGGDNQGLLLDNVKLTKLADVDVSSTEPVDAGVLDLSQASEAWAREWTVLSTAKEFGRGGRPGFYAKAVRVGDAIPSPGREGILYLHPTTRQDPATIVRRVTLTEHNPTLKMGLCGNRNVGADWALTIKINGKPLERERIIAGLQGWQDLAFDLSAFSGQTVVIEIQARANNWFCEYAFFDYIRID